MRMPVWKIFACKKGISFIGNSGIKKFHLGKRKLHLNKKGNSAKNFIGSYKQDILIFFPCDLITVNDYLSDTLKKQNLLRILGCKLYVRIISVN